MKTVLTHRLGQAACLGLAALGTAWDLEAGERQRFPIERSQPASCVDVGWNQNMLRNHPGLIDSCQEVVAAGSRTWARFSAKFLRVESDGSVLFRVRGARNHAIEEVRITPAAGQVAYIDKRPIPFNRLRSGDVINLYIPEGRYGFTTEPGVD